MNNKQQNMDFYKEGVQTSLPINEEPTETQQETDKPVTCLGMTFANDSERRAYFREELRKKLPELKMIEGFPIGEDEDIINLSDPPYYTACPNPWLNDFINLWEEEKTQLVKEGKREKEKVVTEPYARDVSEGKNNPMYMLHTYHTKVPHPAIMRYILHYTEPGDIVFDGFAGTGMTGVAASACESFDNTISKDVAKAKWGKRHAIVSDLAPAATYISSILNSKFNAIRIEKSIKRKLKIVQDRYGWMYESVSPSGAKAKLNFAVWSEKVICPHCGSEMVLWDVSADTVNGRMKSSFECPHCSSFLKKDDCNPSIHTEYDSSTNETIEKRTYELALINYTHNGKRGFKKPDQFDIELANKIEKIEIDNWFPTEKILFKGDDWGDTWRAGIHKGTNRVHHFYTKRNLIFISALWSLLNNTERFVATSILSRNLTKLNRYVLKPRTPHGEVNGPLSGTLYISSEYVEQNPFDLIESKIPSFNWDYSGTITSVGAAQNVLIRDNSVDYIFTDPPFGDNIMYSELNFLWESWLKVITNNGLEAIQNNSQGKGSFEYSDLMCQSFKEYYRILKPGHWITVEFSNTRASVWNAIQSALVHSGFVVANVAALDKKHGGIKSMAYSTAVKEDLIITCYKPTNTFLSKLKSLTNIKQNVWDFIDEYLNHLPIHIEKGNATTAIIERSPKILYDRLISYYVEHGFDVPIDAIVFQQGLRERYIEKDGMFFTATQAAEYDEKKKLAPEFVPMGIIVSDEANGIQWLRNNLQGNPMTYQEIQPSWMQALQGGRKNDIIPELMTLLEENFIKEPDGKWRIPDANDEKDLEILRTKSLLKEFNLCVEQASKPKSKIKEVRVEALRAGFKQCYIDKDFKTIVMVGDKIPENLLTEDEVLLQYYDIASSRV